MKKTTNKFIVVSYQLHTVSNGEKELIEEATENQPYQFISGFGMTLDPFEEKVAALKAGQAFEIDLTPEEAYGICDPGKVLDLEKEIFMVDGKFDSENIFKGAVVPLQNEEGRRFMANILDVTDTTVKADLNHPLAGKSLHFKGTVIENREATNEEIVAVINQISCGCGCGSGDSGCSCGCGSGGCGCGS